MTLKIASLAAGVAVVAIGAFAPLDEAVKMGLIALGGFLCGYPVPAPGAKK